MAILHCKDLMGHLLVCDRCADNSFLRVSFDDFLFDVNLYKSLSLLLTFRQMEIIYGFKWYLAVK